MIAHSFQRAIFVPAQRLHGATYVVDANVRRCGLQPDGLGVDIGLASEHLHALLAALTHGSLDDEPAFEGQNTTPEFLARAIYERLVEAIRAGQLGEGARGL